MAVSAYLMNQITKSRNPDLSEPLEGQARNLVTPWRLIAAEIGYIAATHFAMIEICASLVSVGFLALVGSNREFQMFSKTTKICFSVIGVGMCSIFLNPFRTILPETVLAWNNELNGFVAELYSHI